MLVNGTINQQTRVRPFQILFLMVLIFEFVTPGTAQSVVAWGDDSYNQTDVPPGLTNVLQVKAHGNHTLALRTDGTIAAWGTDFVELAQLSAYADVPAWVPPAVTNVVAIATGRTHSLALLRDGTVAAWSHFSSGQATMLPNGGGGT